MQKQRQTVYQSTQSSQREKKKNEKNQKCKILQKFVFCKNIEK